MQISPRLITENWELKLTALGLAVLLWAGVRSETQTRYRMQNVPVMVRTAEQEWVRVAPPAPQEVAIDFYGPVRELVRVGFGDPRVVVPVEDVDDSVEVYRLQSDWVEMEGGLDNVRIDNISPSIAQLFFQPIETRMVPLAARVQPTRMPNGMALRGYPSAEPAQVQVTGPRNRVQELDSLPVIVRDVPRDSGLVTRSVVLDTAGLGVEISPLEVTVRFELTPVDTTRRTVAPAAARLRPR